MTTKLTQKEQTLRDELINKHKKELYRIVMQATTVDMNDEDEVATFMGMALNKIEDSLIHTYDTALHTGVAHERRDVAFYANYGK